MLYRIAYNKDYDEIILMKNRVKQRIVDSNLPIWQHGYPLDSMIAEDIELGYGRVVEIDNKVVAYSVFLPAEEEYADVFDVANLQSFGRVMVDDGVTGKGVGRFLVGNMISEARENKKTGMGITADSCNCKAVKLYESFGFKKIGEGQFPYAYLDIFMLLF